MLNHRDNFCRDSLEALMESEANKAKDRVTGFGDNRQASGSYAINSNGTRAANPSEEGRSRNNPENNDVWDDEQDNHRQRQNVIVQNVRRFVPIHQWRLNFSGENRDTHLQEFLAQLRILQRSERVSNEDLMLSIVHLLSGRAKL